LFVKAVITEDCIVICNISALIPIHSSHFDILLASLKISLCFLGEYGQSRVWE